MKLFDYFENKSLDVIEYVESKTYDTDLYTARDIDVHIKDKELKKDYMSLLRALNSLPIDKEEKKIKISESDLKRPKIGRYAIQNNPAVLKKLISILKPELVDDKNASRVRLKKGNLTILFGQGSGSTSLGLEMKPQDFIVGDKLLNYNAFIDSLKNGIKTKLKDKNIATFLTMMVDAVAAEKISPSARIINVNIPGFAKVYESIGDEKVIKKIGKNFGELLSGIVAMKIEKLPPSGKKAIEYPNEANYPLIDFFANGKSFSAKFQGGAAPSITSINKYMLALAPELLATKEEKDFHDKVIQPFLDLTLKMAYATVADNMGVRIKGKSCVDYAKKNTNNNDRFFYDHVIKPMVEALNKSKYLKVLNLVSNKIAVDQVFLFFIKKTGVSFKFYHFKDHEFRFVNKATSTAINNVSLGFKMV